MAEKKQVRLACIASGSGTDFESIAKAWKAGMIPEVSEVVLISTKEGAGCLEKAAKLGIKAIYVKPIKEDYIDERGQKKKRDRLSADLLKAALADLGGADLVFLVGCVIIVDNLFKPLPMYNIHPAEPHQHGGQGMYGLAVHKHVLREIMDRIARGMAKQYDRFFTTPTIHEVTPGYDQGKALMQVHVEIPANIIERLFGGTLHPKKAAQMLQKHVLPFEWMMLPCAVRLAAKKILDQKKE